MPTSQSKIVNISDSTSRDGDPQHKPLNVAPLAQQIEDKDYFVERDGLVYAGSHLIVDLWGAQHLTDVPYIEAALRRAIEAAKATLLHIHLHQFGPNGGVSGVAVLAESHISIHTWPERGYAALDVFMCGSAEPMQTIPILKKAFQPETVTIGEHKRGVV